MKKAILLLLAIVLVLAVSCDPDSATRSTTTTTTTTGTATSLTDVNGDTIYSGSATVSFSGTSKTISAAYLIDGVDVEITEGEYSSASGSSDQVVFLVINGGTLTITGTSSNHVTVSKSGSATSGGQVGDDYNFYGINSVIVVAGSTSSATITYADISSTSNGSNAVVATVEGSVTISNSTITTTGTAGSRGLHATYDGSITASDMTITTSGASCATLATDRGGGTISATNMTLSTTSAGSPLVYSTDSITVTNSTGAAAGAQMVVVEGGSTATVNGCTFTCKGDGNRSGTSESNDSSHEVDAAGIFIYQSASGDSADGTSYFNASGSSFTVTDSDTPMFFMTNITAVVTLTGDNTFNLNNSSEYFVLAEATDQWGSSTTGPTVTLTLKESLTGSIVYRDSYSSLSINSVAMSSGETTL